LAGKNKFSEMVPFVVKFRMFLGKILFDEVTGRRLDHNDEVTKHSFYHYKPEVKAQVNYRVEFEFPEEEETDATGNVVVDVGDAAITEKKDILRETG
jgi:hypothetical protein